MEIDLKILSRVLWRKKWLILLVGIICGMGASVYYKYTDVPLYLSEAKVYVLSRKDETSLSTSDLNVSADILNDVKHLIGSDRVAGQVCRRLGLPEGSGDYIISTLKLSVPDNSRMLFINSITTDPALSKDIVDAVAEISSEEMKQLIGIEKANIIDYGRLGSRVNPRHGQKACLCAFAGAFAVVLIALTQCVYDDKIRSSEDMAEVSGIAVIGLIPRYSQKKKWKG